MVARVGQIRQALLIDEAVLLAGQLEIAGHVERVRIVEDVVDGALDHRTVRLFELHRGVLLGTVYHRIGVPESHAALVQYRRVELLERLAVEVAAHDERMRFEVEEYVDAPQVHLDPAEYVFHLHVALVRPLHFGLEVQIAHGHQPIARHVTQLQHDEHLRVDLAVEDDLLEAQTYRLEEADAEEDRTAVRTNVAWHEQRWTLKLGHKHARVSVMKSVYYCIVIRINNLA